MSIDIEFNSEVTDTWLSKLDVFTDSYYHVFIIIIGYNKLLIIASQPYWSIPT